MSGMPMQPMTTPPKSKKMFIIIAIVIITLVLLIGIIIITAPDAGSSGSSRSGSAGAGGYGAGSTGSAGAGSTGSTGAGSTGSAGAGSTGAGSTGAGSTGGSSAGGSSGSSTGGSSADTTSSSADNTGSASGSSADTAGADTSGAAADIPVDCVQSEWSECDKPCGGGTQTRSVVTDSLFGGVTCGPDSQECNAQICDTSRDDLVPLISKFSARIGDTCTGLPGTACHDPNLEETKQGCISKSALDGTIPLQYAYANDDSCTGIFPNECNGAPESAQSTIGYVWDAKLNDDMVQMYRGKFGNDTYTGNKDIAVQGVTGLRVPGAWMYKPSLC
jgi:hypothetical protein